MPGNDACTTPSSLAGWAAVIALAPFLLLASSVVAVADEPASFVGGRVCSECHAAEFELWEGSHHALAMQAATPNTVLGDFSNARLEHLGTTTTFLRADGTFLVRADGPDGALHEYPISYTFGVSPLQQYLIALPGGRLQAFGIAWDSRPQDQGGQRWFHLNPDQKLSPPDRLHWTGRDQTWNHMCADCHSTGVRKNFDLTSNTYATKWAEIEVSCEACHGPGSNHVAWSRSRSGTDSDPQDRMGLIAWLRATDNGRWQMNTDTGIAARTEPLASAELDTCAGCHARRKDIAEPREPGAPFLDSYLPALLEPGLYHPDGQIDGEVFEYGSFLQSRMYSAGVTCSNCHEPHGLKLRASGNGLCAQCHVPAKFDVVEHHHHESGSVGAQCVNCHMPAKTYMGVDRRHDHSFRVPRPDLSLSIGTPNTCNQCHAGQSAEWAARIVTGWFPNGRQTLPHYATALHAGRTVAADAERLLDALIQDPRQPAIARASALALLPGNASAASTHALRVAIADPSPLVRMAAPRALPVSRPPALVEAAAPLLGDPVRAVRIEAARALAGVDPRMLTLPQQEFFAKAYAELVAAEMVDADRPEAHLNLGLSAIRRRQPDQAEAAYRTALRLDPDFVPAMMNLADLDRMRGRDEQGAWLLRTAIALEPANADVRHALGLLLVRRHDYAGALPLLREAGELAPENARYARVYAIALNAAGNSALAVAVLEQVRRRHPTDADVLIALVSITRDRGDPAVALQYARTLAALRPADMQARMLVLQLEQRPAP